MKRCGSRILLRTTAFFAAALVLLLLCGTASAEGPHTVVVKCSGGGFVGISQSKIYGISLTPDTGFTSADGNEWTLETLFREPGFRLEGATLRFTVTEVEGPHLL